MDRASVFGTDDAATEGAESQALTDSDLSARSAGRSAQDGIGPLDDTDLALVVDTWPRMTPEAKRAVLAIIGQADRGLVEDGQERPQEARGKGPEPEADLRR